MVLQTGMIRAGTVLNEPQYVNFVRKWADHWHRKGIDSLLNRRGYCGRWGPGLPLMMLYDRTNEERYLEMVGKIVDFMDRATRTSRGGIGHWEGNHQLWVDTLYMVCPVYVRYGVSQKKPQYVKRANRQLAVFADRLQDQETGLFYHMYDEEEHRRTPAFWARGNGWVIMSYVEVLKRLDDGSNAYGERMTEFRSLVSGILETQDEETGLWHTLMTRPTSYLEVSASAMFLYAMLQARNEGLYRGSSVEPLHRAWTGLAGKVDKKGRVLGVSGGTGPGSYEDYLQVGGGTHPWGTGAWLLAAAEMADF